MILAAGLTPAWQQIYTFSAFRPGEVNRARKASGCASGKVLNVGLALHRLGGACRTLSLVGSGPAGAAMRSDFDELGVSTRWIRTAAAARVCTTILDETGGSTTELIENAAAVTAAELDSFRAAYRDEVSAARLVVLTGSLPARADATFYRDLLAAVPVPTVLDGRGPELTAALEARPFLIKPNREELVHTVRRELPTEADVFAAMRELHRSGAEIVVVTQGPGPVLAVSAEAQYRALPPVVRVINPIGCGDCLAAGLAEVLASGGELREALRVGVAAAANNLGDRLPSRLDPVRVRKLAEQVVVDVLQH